MKIWCISNHYTRWTIC